ADDPEFAAVTQKIRKEQDPAEFIRGGSTGYSSFRTQPENPQPYLRESLEPLHPDIPEVDTAEPDLQRQYADLYDHRSLRIAVQPLQKDTVKTVDYPVWTDAYGIIHEIKDAYKEHYAVNFNSKDVVGPTVLKIQFPENKHSDLPPHISIQRSCGSVFLDYHAKKLLRKHIINKEFQKKFDVEYNNQIRIYWRPGLNPENKNMIPDNMLVQKEN
ncbi:MAG: hypothetical protein J6Q65_08530, partial [Lentisphaeria bacterium]|nr:hypothetical protein [Lentisphaeria bacterium]